MQILVANTIWAGRIHSAVQALAASGIFLTHSLGEADLVDLALAPNEVKMR
jgi:predicted alpha/beta hydrolase family esterase